MVIGADDRQIITSFDDFPYSTVTAVDISLETEADGQGTGIIIAPKYVLTAGHNAYKTNTVKFLRATISSQQNKLDLRYLDVFGNGLSGDPNANVYNDNISFPANYGERTFPVTVVSYFSFVMPGV